MTKLCVGPPACAAKLRENKDGPAPVVQHVTGPSPHHSTEPRSEMPTIMPVPPPCVGQSELFDSTDWFDHLAARTICAGCPFVTACVLEAVAAGHADGTWGGLLWRCGDIQEVLVPQGVAA